MIKSSELFPIIDVLLAVITFIILVIIMQAEEEWNETMWDSWCYLGLNKYLNMY